MIYFSIFILFLLLLIIFLIVINSRISTLNFQKKIQFLEDLIQDLKINLENNNQKVKLSEDLKIKYNQSNFNLSQSIFDLNLGLFDELYSKK